MELLKPRDIAQMLGVSVQTVHKLCRKGMLEYIQIDSKNRRFTHDAVERYLEAKTCPARHPSVTVTTRKPKSQGPRTRPSKTTKRSKEERRKEMDSW
ncbi:helix-turn-helix domain-containing protein [Thermodesulfobacteriota bacterium]